MKREELLTKEQMDNAEVAAMISTGVPKENGISYTAIANAYIDGLMTGIGMQERQQPT
jgi:hypothetical protein